MMESKHIPALFREHGRLRRFFAGQQLFLKDAPAEEIYYLERRKAGLVSLFQHRVADRGAVHPGVDRSGHGHKSGERV